MQAQENHQVSMKSLQLAVHRSAALTICFDNAHHYFGKS